MKRPIVRLYLPLLTFIFVFVSTFTFFKLKTEPETSAASSFSAGNIISDYVMSNFNSMSETEIQTFLKSKNSCNNTNYSLYQSVTKQYPNTTWHWKDGHFVCMADETFDGETAAHIIWQAAQDYKINPQVLIVLLEKEQGLISDDYPNSVQYRSATGYGCPDTATCDSKYYGLKNQIRNAAALFRTVLDGGWTNFPLGENYIQYNPDRSCGGSTVKIENLATSALYRYTPYQPNSATIAAGSGTAPCGSYGNRNFYNYFTRWFGDTHKMVAISSPVEQTVQDGVYRIVSSSSQNYSMDISGGVNASTKTADLILWNKKNQTSENISNQIFQIKYNKSDGYYEIINPLTNSSLDVYNGDVADNTKIIIWPKNNGCNQKWQILKNNDRTYSFISVCSGKALDLYNYQITQNTRIVLKTKNNSKSQQWNLEPIEKQTGLSGVYRIESKINNKQVMDISGGVTQTSKNGKAIIWSLKTSNNSNQLFRISYDETTGAYEIINPLSGLLLDVENANTANETPVIFWPKNNGCNQKWQIKQNQNGYTISSLCSGKVLDIYGADSASGNKLIIFNDHSGSNQRWDLVKIED